MAWNEQKWPALMNQYWHCNWLRSEEDVRTASAELEIAFRNRIPDNAEICKAIRWMAGPENRQEKAPTLRELNRAICICRKSPDADSSVLSDCGLCRGTGWLVYHQLETPFTHPDDLLLAPAWSVPCLCSGGTKVMNVCEDFKKARPEYMITLDENRQAARTQTVAIERWYAEAAREIKDYHGDARKIAFDAFRERRTV